MWLTLKKYIAPPVYENDDEKTCAAVVLNILQLTLFAIMFGGSVAIVAVFSKKVPSLSFIVGFLIVLILSRVLMYRGYVRQASLCIIVG